MAPAKHAHQRLRPVVPRCSPGIPGLKEFCVYQLLLHKREGPVHEKALRENQEPSGSETN